MTENENFLVSIGFTQEEYMGKLWWVDPFFEKDDNYRYVLCVDEEPGYSVHGMSIEQIMQVIKSNVYNRATKTAQKEAKAAMVREVEYTLRKFLK
jgi:hypothetical protein